MKPLAIDLFCGLGGWTEGLLSEGYQVIGFDIEAHRYGEDCYPGQLVIQDVRTIHGSQFKDAALIVASPPCQKYSYMAMPWTRAKNLIEWYREETHPGRIDELNELFDACFRIQREACEAAERHIPLVVENVCGAQPWVGRARWRYGSYYLWGDVPALMPIVSRRPKFKGGDRNEFRASGGHKWSPHWTEGVKVPGLDWSSPDKDKRGCFRDSALKNPGFRFDGSKTSFQSASVNGHIKNSGGSWFNVAHNKTSGKGRNPDGRKCGGAWFGKGNDMNPMRRHNSQSSKRRYASALIAKIPFELSSYIARVYKNSCA